MVKHEVFEVLDDYEDELELNRRGEIAVHGRTLIYWTEATSA